MGRVLTAIAFGLVAVALVFGAGHGKATTWYSGKVSTGYAFGSLTGAASGLGELTQGHFANHSSTWCPGDPSAYWSFGTWIWGLSPAPTMYQGDGSAVYPTSFMLHDIGDPTCSGGSYWVDLYFGRYKNPNDDCDCNNATEVFYISYNYVNNCQDAWAHGWTYVGYYGPD
ncbi:MAG: hypothetical protein FIB00_00610 [Chloroflexi bacterium]|nr:hypothetical protein [Chloroflexota bacterium]